MKIKSLHINNSIYVILFQTSEYVQQLYNHRIANHIDGVYEDNNFALLGYDAVWTLALALEKTLGFADKSEADNVTSCSGWSGELVPLEHFNYTNGYMGCVIRWALAQTDYIGTSVSCVNIRNTV